MGVQEREDQEWELGSAGDGGRGADEEARANQAGGWVRRLRSSLRSEI